MLHVFLGTAAECIKVWPVLTALDRRGVAWTAWATGQSGVSLQRQWEDCGLAPGRLAPLVASTRDLGRRREAAAWLARAVSRLLRGPPGGAGTLRPRLALVHGDTLSAALGAVLACRLGVPLAHLEAGLTSEHLLEPFPEELCRRLVSRGAAVLFAPGDAQAEHLRRRRVRGEVVVTHGNTLADAVRAAGDDGAASAGERYCLANLHRFENLHQPRRLRHLVDVVVRAAARARVIMVLHEQTRARLAQAPALERALRDARVDLQPRMPFRRFVALLRRAWFLLSDGGSNQEESSYLGVPCLLLREHTERQEGLGRNCVLSGLDRGVAEAFLADPDAHRHPECWPARPPSDVVADALQRRLG